MKLISAAFYRRWLQDRLRDRPTLHRMVANAGWLLVDKTLRMPVSLAMSIWLARYLGPDRMGALGYAMAFAGLFSVLAGLGLDSITVRELVNDPAAKEEVLGTAFFLKVVGGAATLLLTVVAISFVRPADPLERSLVAIIAAGTIFQAFDVCDYWFQSRVQSKYKVLAQAPGFLVLSALKVGLILSQAPLVAFAWVALGEVAVGSIAVAMVFRARVQPFTAWRFSARRARAMLSDSWPFALGAMVGMFFLRIDQVMLGQIVGAEEVGIYTVAVRLAEILIIVSMTISASTLPSILEARRVSDEFFHERLQKLYNLMAFIGYAVAVPVTVWSSWIIAQFFGESYIRAAPMLTVLVWASVLLNLGLARSAFLTAMNWTKLHLYSSIFAAVCNVLLNLWLIPRYGGLGAAFASLGAYWIGSQGSSLLFRPLRKNAKMMAKAMIWPKIW